VTASLKTFTVHYVSLGNPAAPLDVSRGLGAGSPVVIHLGNGHVIEGNQPADFQSLKDAAEKALSMFDVTAP
jgi:hypothetical protein